MRNLLRLVLLTAGPLVSASVAQGNLVGFQDPDRFVVYDLATGASSLTSSYPSHEPSVYSLAHSGGTLYVSQGYRLSTIDPAVGVPVPINNITPGHVTLTTMAADPATGVLYGLDAIQNPPRLHVVDSVTASATLIGDTGLSGRKHTGLAIDGRGRAFAWDHGDQALGNGIGLVEIDLATGLAVDVNPLIGDIAFVVDMAFAGDVLFAVAGNNLFVVDTVTGDLRLHAVGGGMDKLSFRSGASVRVHGPGCPGGVFAPVFTAGSLPAVGSTLALRGDLLAANSSGALLAIGFDGSSSAFGPLPFDLSQFGLGASCVLSSSADFAVFLPVQTAGGFGAVDYSLGIPAGATFVGVELFFQLLADDPGAVGGAAVSRTIAVVIG